MPAYIRFEGVKGEFAADAGLWTQTDTATDTTTDAGASALDGTSDTLVLDLARLDDGTAETTDDGREGRDDPATADATKDADGTATGAGSDAPGDVDGGTGTGTTGGGLDLDVEAPDGGGLFDFEMIPFPDGDASTYDGMDFDGFLYRNNQHGNWDLPVIDGGSMLVGNQQSNWMVAFGSESGDTFDFLSADIGIWASSGTDVRGEDAFTLKIEGFLEGFLMDTYQIGFGGFQLIDSEVGVHSFTDAFHLEPGFENVERVEITVTDSADRGNVGALVDDILIDWF